LGQPSDTRPQPLHAKSQARQPSRRHLVARLPAYTFHACAPIAPHPRISAHLLQPTPNTLPDCAQPQNPASILFLPPRETQQQNKSKSPAAYSPSISIRLRCLRSTFSKSKSPAPCPLHQTRFAQTDISPPAL